MTDKNIMSVNQLYHCEVAKIMHMIAINDAPESLISIFAQQSRFSNMNLRSASIYLPALSSTLKGQQCINFTGPSIWNNLPMQIKKDISRTNENINLDETNYFPIKRFVLNMRSYALNDVDYI